MPQPNGPMKTMSRMTFVTPEAADTANPNFG